MLLIRKVAGPMAACSMLVLGGLLIGCADKADPAPAPQATDVQPVGGQDTDHDHDHDHDGHADVMDDDFSDDFNDDFNGGLRFPEAGSGLAPGFGDLPDLD